MKSRFTHLIIIFTLCLISEMLLAQAPNWEWAHNEIGAGSEFGKSLTSDGNGFVYAVGSFYGTSIILGNDTLLNPGSGSIYLVKYDPLGNVVWAKAANGYGGQFGLSANDIIIDANGNIIIAGEFSTFTVTFDTTVLTNTTTNSTGDIFIAKYDTSGNLLSVVSNGGNDNDRAEGVTCDKNGNVYVTGAFESPSIVFGSTTLTLTAANYFDMFIVKYDNAGNVLWAKKAGGTDHDDGAGVCIDSAGDIYVTGWFRSPIILFGNTTLSNPSGWNFGFVVKYSSSGIVQWAKRAGDASMSITADDAGYIYITGEFSGTFAFDTVVLNSTAYLEMFVTKYDLSGNVIWAKNSVGTATRADRGYGIALDPIGNIYVTGIFSSDSIAFGNKVISNFIFNGAYDIFVVKYDNLGNELWAKGVGGNDWDIAYDIINDVSGNIYVTGYFQSPSISFDSTTLTMNGGNDMFIAKIGGDIVSTGLDSIQSSEKMLIYPNPLSQFTTISFTLSKPQNVSLNIFDMRGNLIYHSDKTFEAGENKLVWSADDVNEGIYFLQIHSAENFQTEKLIVVH